MLKRKIVRRDKSEHWVLIDNKDSQKYAMYTWRVKTNETSTKKNYYVCGVPKGTRGKGAHVYLQVLIMQPPKGYCVDHINGNPLDNRRKNLRIVTFSQNARNSAKSKSSKHTSQYKGVDFQKDKGMWRARVKIKYKEVYIGSYATEKGAAHAYNEYVYVLDRRHFRLNKFI